MGVVIAPAELSARDAREQAPTERLDDDALIWAARLLACGINVVPVLPGTKKAATAWKFLQDGRLIETWSAEELDRYLLSWWPAHGLGIVTGAVSDLVVVDVDSPAAR